MARDHLAVNRSLILGRAAVAQVAALLPLPLVDDLLADAARVTLLRRLAAVRGVGIDEPALAVLAQVEANRLTAAAGTAAGRLLRRSIGRTVRRIANFVYLATQAGDFANTFAVATLFDHYCARHHVGPGLDAAGARRLRQVIDAAIVAARADFARSSVRGAASRTGALLLAAPRAITFRAPLPGRATVELVRPGEQPRAASGSLVRRGLRAVGSFAGATGQGWIDALVSAFDRLWAARADEPEGSG